MRFSNIFILARILLNLKLYLDGMPNILPPLSIGSTRMPIVDPLLWQGGKLGEVPLL